MDRFTKDFIESVLKEVKCSQVHPHIAQELEDHIECLKEGYTEEGTDEDQSYEKAIKHMGDPTSIGKHLHKIHKPKLEWSVIVSVVILIGIGLMALYYSGGYDYYRYVEGLEYLEPYIFFRKQIQCVTVGSMICICIYFLNYRILEKLSMVGYALGLFVLAYGQYRGGNEFTIRWVIEFGPFTVLSTVLAIPILVVSFVGLVHRWGNNEMRRYWILGAVALFPSVFISQQGISYGLILGISFMMTLTFHLVYSLQVTEKKKLLSIMYGTAFGSGIFGIIGLMYTKGDYIVQRIQMFMHPEWDAKGNGYIPSVMKAIRESTTFIGDGGFSTVDIKNLPDPTNDIIFTFILGSMGWLVGFLVIIVIGCIIGRMFCAALKVNESYGRLMCMTIASLFALQFVYNIAMNLGYVPQMAVALPFVSYGGTSMMINMGLVGVFLSIYRKKDIVLLENHVKKLG